tara:strand:+ start:785 stop:1066 length:282 start_codon:yes stop_codon:yes gene_type:complete
MCGAEDEPVPTHLADTRKLCDDCIQVMWKEQYRRNVLDPMRTGQKPVASKPKKVVVEDRSVMPRRFKPLRHYLKETAPAEAETPAAPMFNLRF